MASRSKALTFEAARGRAVELYDDGCVRESSHFTDRMKEWDVIEWDILQTIYSGVIRDSHWNEDHEEWRYQITGVTTDGDPLSIIFSIYESIPEVVMITCGIW